ncbi:phage integrase SAM-like domain-containing protein [uncultured Lutibacter sp.]|uniref:phage integrase SAM-like domain-containing protein n=1 Tax=uncultured Lutibacter sp. TaxID=437739 RepID=UPI002607A99A|nr:phage integrase SAM-like domain-containing protein [uncultured Lutibacter sp.]
MATINLLIQSKKDPATIYIRLRDGKILDIKAKTNYHINPIDWDKSRQRPLKKLLKDIKYANLETDLLALKSNLLMEYNKAKGNDTINSQWLKDFINPPKEEEKFSDRLVEYIDTYIDFKKNDVAKATIVKCNVIKQLLIRYEKHIGSSLLINDINNDFKRSFEKYCLNEGYAKNTTAKNIRYIKSFCKHAKSNGIETHPQLDSLKTKYYKVDHIYLSEAEIKKIEKLKVDELTDGLKNAKDWLLISCYCGQRVSDFMRFKKSMIRYEENKKGKLKPLLEFTQVKTGKVMTIPLHKKIMRILENYDGEFPKKISDQRYNEHIKKVCEKAKIKVLTLGTKFNRESKQKETKKYPKWELVTSHIGRRSFATNNYGKIPTSFLMHMTGHTTEKMFLTYIGKSNKDIAMELTKYF